MRNKKGQTRLEDLAKVAIIFVFLGFIIAAGAIVLTNFQDTSGATGSYSKSDSNDINLLNETAVYFGDTDTRGVNATSCAGAQFFNGTNAVNITENVTVDTNRCVATLDAGPEFNNTNVEVNYTVSLTTYDYTFNNSEDGLLATSNLSDQLPTLGTIIGVVAIIVVVVGGFAFFLRGRGGL